MIPVNDPNLINDLEDQSAGREAPTGASLPTQQLSGVDNDAWVYKTEDASILDTAGQKLKTAWRGFLESQASPENSNFANRMTQLQAEEYKQSREKLGIVGQVGADLTALGAAIPAGMVNPYLGGAVAAGVYTAENLANQAVEGQQADLGSAFGYGAAAGAADLATGGLAGRFRAGMTAAKPLAATTGFLPTSLGQRAAHAAKQAAPGIGLNVAEDASAAIAGNAFSNLAVGKNWDEGIGEAALMGGVGGQAIRGSLAGLNKARQTLPNIGGQKVAEDIKNLKTESGFTPTDSFTGESFGYNNQYAEMVDTINNSTDPSVRSETINAAVNMAAKSGGRAADLLVLKMAQKDGLPLMDHAFDVNLTQGMEADGATYNLADEIGISQKERRISGEIAENAQPARFGRDKAVREGLTKEADQDLFKKKFDVLDTKMRKPFNDNIALIEEQIDIAKNNPSVDPARLDKLSELRTNLRALRSDVNSYTGSEKKDMTGDLRINARRSMEIASELGILGDLKGIDGGFNPLVDAMAIDRLERISRSRMPGIHQGTPTKHKNKFLGSGPVGNTVDAALVMTGNLPAAIARRAVGLVTDEALAHSSQRALRKSREITSQRLAGIDRAMEARKTAAMEAGDAKSTADISAVQLANEGINTSSVAQGVDDVVAQMDQPVQSPVDQEVARSAPLAARDPRQMMTKEEILAVDEVAKTDPQGAEQLAQEIMAQKSSPVPAREPVRPTPEVAPELIVEPPVPGAMSQGMVKEPTAPKIQEPEVESTVTPEPEIIPEPEVAPEAPRSDSKGMAKKPKQAQVEEPEVAPAKTEEVTEPTVEPEAKTSATELVRQPLKKMRDEFSELSNNQKREMLKTNPEKYHEMERAKNDLKELNTIVERVSSQLDTTPDVISGIVQDLGGMKGIREALRDPEVNVDPRTFVHDKTRDLMRLKKKEAHAKVEDLRKLASEKKPVTEADIATKQIDAREELRSLGFKPDEVDTAFKAAGVKDSVSDFDPKIVKNWAKTQQKQRLDEANALAKEASDNARRAAQASKEYASKVMDEGKRKNLESDIREQITAFEGVVKSKTAESKDKISARSKLKDLEEALDNVTTKQEAISKEAKAKAEAAKEKAQAMEAAKAEADRLKKASKETQEKMKEGVEEKATIAEVKAKVKDEIADMDDITLQEAAKDIAELDKAVKDYSAPEVKGVTDAIADELRARGQKDEGDYISAFSRILAKAEQRKAKYPDNKEFWILGDEKQELQKLMNKKEGGSFMGNLQKQLSLRFFGDAEAGPTYIRLSQSEIDSRIAKGALGSDDIVVKPTWKQKGRLVNKSQAGNTSENAPVPKEPSTQKPPKEDLSSKKPTEASRSYKAGKLTSSERDGVAKAIKSFTGKELKPSFKETLYGEKFSKDPKGPINKSVYQLWQTHLSDKEMNVALNTLSNMRKKKK